MRQKLIYVELRRIKTKIETKYSKGDIVYYFNGNRIFEGKISHIYIKVFNYSSGSEFEIKYETSKTYIGSSIINENELFISKKECISNALDVLKNRKEAIAEIEKFITK